MAIKCEVDIVVGCALAYTCWDYMPICHNGCMAHICNVAAIFVPCHQICVQGHETWYTCLYTCINKYTYTDIHIQTQCMSGKVHPKCIHSYLHAHILVYIHMNAYSHAYMFAFIFTHLCMCL